MARFTAYSQRTEDVQESHNTLVSQLNKAWANPVFSSAWIGGTSDYIALSSSGIRLNGGATVFEDRDYPLGGQRISAPGAKVVESTNNLIAYSTNCPLGDYVWMNIQMSHSKKLFSPIYPHVHWNQDSTKLPNWLLEYRWMYGGIAIPSTWSYSTMLASVYPLTAGISQITPFATITPSSNEGLSAILQVKLKRDSSNTSAKFASTDPYGASAFAASFDIHYERDSMGSDSEYSK